MRISARTEWPNWLIIASMFAWAAATWSTAPDQFPVHWNLAGEVDRYGGKVEGLLLLPLTTLALYILLILLPRIDPGRANYVRFANAYAGIRLALTVFLAAVYAVSQVAAYGHPVDVSAIIFVLVGGLFIVLGIFLPRIQPNWFVGIRTPWTLSSRTSWTRTHRLGGKLFILMGSAIAASALSHSVWAYVIAGAIVVGCLVGVTTYSYVIWRSDPDRVTPGGSTPT